MISNFFFKYKKINFKNLYKNNKIKNDFVVNDVKALHEAKKKDITFFLWVVTNILKCHRVRNDKKLNQIIHCAPLTLKRWIKVSNQSPYRISSKYIFNAEVVFGTNHACILINN